MRVPSRPNSPWGRDLEWRNRNLGSASVTIASFSPLPRGLFGREDTRIQRLTYTKMWVTAFVLPPPSADEVVQFFPNLPLYHTVTWVMVEERGKGGHTTNDRSRFSRRCGSEAEIVSNPFFIIIKQRILPIVLFFMITYYVYVHNPLFFF